MYDTNSFWSAGSNTRFTIPAGVTKVKLSASMTGATQTDQVNILIYKNGTNVYSSQPEVDSTGADVPAAFTPVLSVVAGDYFTLIAYSQLARNIGETPEGYTSWFSIEVVEGTLLNTTVASTLTLGSSLLSDVNIVSPSNNQSLVYDTASSKWINGLPLTAGTVTTAAQPNITSVGTLASLSVTGNVAANYFTGNGSLLTSVAALTATSATTAGTVTTAAQPNITSTGTLTGLTVTGNVLFSGPNVTLGDVANLHISGGTANYVLKTDGAGTLSWTAQSGGGGSSNAAGANTQIQFNDGNVFAGSAGLTFNKTTTTLTANNLVATTTANLGAVGNVTITGGTGGQVLSTNGSNVLSWITPAASTTSTTPTSSITVDSFTGDGTTVVYTLSITPINITQTQVNYNGVIQLRSSYSIVGSSIVFTEAPLAGSYIEVTTTQGVTANSGTYVVRTYTGDGVTTMFTVTNGSTASSLLVTENGILQTPTSDYTVSGTVITFTTASVAGVAIQIRELGIFVVNSSTTTTDILSPFLLMGA